jgi:FtsH-binding integral membrane protein
MSSGNLRNPNPGEPSSSDQVADRRTLELVLLLVPSFTLLAAVLTAVWALTGMDSAWPFYVLFAVGAGFIMVVIRGSRSPVKFGLVAFAFGAASMITVWALTDVAATLLFQALLVWGWFCGKGAVTGRRRAASPSKDGAAGKRSPPTP